MSGGTPPGGSDLPVLHLVTDGSVLERAGFRDTAKVLLEAGGPRVALHLRGAGVGGGSLYRLASDLAPVAAASGAWLVLNDRVDVALASGIDRVQVGARSVPVPVARSLLGPGARIGVSVHGAPEAEEAARVGADWMFAGTVYATPTHPGREGCGVDGLAGIVAAARGVPVFAIGGVTPRRLPGILGAGARGAAVIRGVWNAGRPTAALFEYLDALAQGAGDESGEA